MDNFNVGDDAVGVPQLSGYLFALLDRHGRADYDRRSIGRELTVMCHPEIETLEENKVLACD